MRYYGDEPDFYDDKKQEEKEIVGYCAYNKEPIREDDDVVRYKGELYLRANFLQSQLDGHGNFIEAEDEE